MNPKIAAVLAVVGASLGVTKKVVASTGSTTPYLNKPWYPSLVKIAGQNKIPVSIALSQVKQESNGNERALGSAGEVGLLQLKGSVLQDYVRATHDTHRDLYNPVDNLTVGLWYLAWIRDHYQLSIHDSLLAYNSGIGNFQKGRIQNPKYATDIIGRAQTYAV